MLQNLQITVSKYIYNHIFSIIDSKTEIVPKKIIFFYSQTFVDRKKKKKNKI